MFSVPFTEFYCQPTGSNLNAGSTTADAAAKTYLSGTWVQGTGIFTVASGNPVTDGINVGDFASVYIDGATVGVFVGRVTDRDATTITVSLTAKSGTAPADGTSNRTLKVGGAWKGPNAAEQFPFNFAAGTMTNVAGDVVRVNLKNGTAYSITAAIGHNAAGPVMFRGYTTSPGDGGRCTIQGPAAGAAFALVTLSSAQTVLEDAFLQFNGDTGSQPGLTVGTSTIARRVVVAGMTGRGITMGAVSSRGCAIECEAYACNTSNTAGLGGIACTGIGQYLIRCISHDNVGNNANGFEVSGLSTLVGCIADTNGGNGFQITSTSGATILGCDAYNNTGSGINLANATAALFYIENCNLVKNGAYGINGSGAGARSGYVANCGFGSGTQVNVSGDTTGLSALNVTGSITYPADQTPWVDPANGDFRVSLSQAKGAGRGSFLQTAPAYAGTVGYPDVGAAQHAESVLPGRLPVQAASYLPGRF